jgi:PAS domain S-box-containing protein
VSQANTNLYIELENRIRFETLISDISARFVRLSSSTVDSEIDHALKQIVDFFEVDRCAMLGVREDQRFVWVTHACYAEGIAQVSKDINLAELFPWSYENLIIKRLSVRVERMTELPSEAEQDRLSFSAMGVQSSLVIPLFGSQGIRYLLAIQSLLNEHDWPKEFVPRLNLLGEIFVNVLERKDIDYALKESESRLNLATDSAGVGLWILDVHTHQVWVTPKLRELFHFASDEEVNYERFFTVIHPEDNEMVRQAVKQTLQANEKLHVEYRIVLPDGGIRWIGVHGRLYFELSGESDKLMGVSLDITEHKQLQDQARNAAEQWQITFDAVQNLIMVLDPEFRIVRINKAAVSFFGHPSEQILGSHYYALIYGTNEPFQSCPVVRSLVSKQHEECEIYLDWKSIWLLISADPIIDEKGNVVGFISILIDITSRKRNEKKLIESQKTLRAFASRLLTIQEEERRCLARELHDDFTQRLAVLAMDLSRITVSAKTAHPGVESGLELVREQIIKLSTDILDISRQLHPSIIDDLGLGRAIQSECTNAARRTGIAIHYKSNRIPPAIPYDISVSLFRITQEAIRNIHKHAHVTDAEVCLVGEEDGISLTVQDLGAGFDPECARQEHGLGLFSMKERVQLIGGVFSIDSAPGQGTQIKVVVPLKGIGSGKDKSIIGR